LWGDYTLHTREAQRLTLNYWGYGFARYFVHSPLEREVDKDQGAINSVSLRYLIDPKDANDWSMQARVTFVDISFNVLEQTTLAGVRQRTDPPNPDSLTAELLFRKPLPAGHALTAAADARLMFLIGGAYTPGAGVGIDASVLLADNVKLTDWLFADAAFRIGMRTFTGGLTPTRPLYSPRIGFSFPLHSQHTLRLSVSYSQRPPSPYDLFATEQLPSVLQGNPALRPEGVGSLDLGYELHIGKVEASVTPWVMLYHDIRERTETLPTLAVNASHPIGFGGELTVKYEPAQGVLLRANYSLASYWQNGAPYAAGAPHKVNVIANASLPFGFSVNGAAGYVSTASYFAPTADTFPTRVPLTVPWRFYADLSVRYRHTNGFELQLSGYNLSRIGPLLRPEYPGAAQPVAPRIMLTVGYESPVPAAPGTKVWHDRWYTQVLWFAGIFVAFLSVGLLPLVTPTI
jgi:outer membrane receptor protein involved in Fe transport